jgi:hypothetical protein
MDIHAFGQNHSSRAVHNLLSAFGEVEGHGLRTRDFGLGQNYLPRAGHNLLSVLDEPRRRHGNAYIAQSYDPLHFREQMNDQENDKDCFLLLHPRHSPRLIPRSPPHVQGTFFALQDRFGEQQLVRPQGQVLDDDVARERVRVEGARRERANSLFDLVGEGACSALILFRRESASGKGHGIGGERRKRMTHTGFISSKRQPTFFQ